ncbi:MAG: signal peptidase I, partial [Negativicoccus succinicivorans]|nr:signal peptidase I [Negativicoccus succinicivorans]
GDRLGFRDGHVYRNGRALNEPYINEPMKFNLDGEFIVPEGTVFVMGDNRNHSSDSRYIGPVPIGHVLGNVVYEF